MMADEMTRMTIRNPVRISAELIDCEIEHPVHGWMPFTATTTDSADYGPVIHAICAAMLDAPQD